MKSIWVKILILISLLATFVLFQNFTPSQRKKQKIDFNSAIESSFQEADKIENEYSQIQIREKVTNEGLVPLGSKMNRVQIEGSGESVSVSGESVAPLQNQRRPANRVDQTKMIEEELRAKDR